MKKIVPLLPFFSIIVFCLIAVVRLTSPNDIPEGKIIQVYINNKMKDNLLLADEVQHFDQIVRLTKPNPSLNHVITSLPGYHLAVAGIIRLIGLIRPISPVDPILVRIISSLVNLLFIPVAYLLSRVLDKNNSMLTTLQICFFPLFFPFFPLIYTDLFALTLVLLTLHFLSKGRYGLSGIAGIGSLLIRQNNIVWFPFYLALIFIKENQSGISTDAIFNHLKKCWVFYLGLILFAIFVYRNNGISLGEKNMNPFVFPRFDNLFFLLFSFFFLFLPLNVKNYPKIITLLIRKPFVWLVLAAGYFFYQKVFIADHPYNMIHLFIRNDILMLMRNDLLLQVCFYLFSCYSLLSIVTTRLIERSVYSFYLFAVVSVLSFWLIEPRYYFVPFALFLLFRKKEGSGIEYSQLIFNICLSLYIFQGTILGKFFI